MNQHLSFPASAAGHREPANLLQSSHFSSPPAARIVSHIQLIGSAVRGLSPVLQDWCEGAARLVGTAGDRDRRRILYDTCKALEFLHLRSIVHWSFGPRAVMWFPQAGAWKLVALGTWARWVMCTDTGGRGLSGDIWERGWCGLYQGGGTSQQGNVMTVE